MFSFCSLLICYSLSLNVLAHPESRNDSNIPILLKDILGNQNNHSEVMEHVKLRIGETISHSKTRIGILMNYQKMLRNITAVQSILLDNLNGIKKQLDQMATSPIASDCSDLFLSGARTSGIYTVQPLNWKTVKAIQVSCDMDTDDGGWTVLQRRGEFGVPRENFSRTWLEYRTGFGYLDKEFWLGNDHISALSRQKKYELRIDMRDKNLDTSYAKYETFLVESGRDNYRLVVEGYSGTAGDSFSYHNAMSFSTEDRDNDAWSQNCAQTYQSGWWYNDCHRANLNGPHLSVLQRPKHQGLVWGAWNKYISFTEIKIRPVDY